MTLVANEKGNTLGVFFLWKVTLKLLFSLSATLCKFRNIHKCEARFFASILSSVHLNLDSWSYSKEKESFGDLTVKATCVMWRCFQETLMPEITTLKKKVKRKKKPQLSLSRREIHEEYIVIIEYWDGR
jgi:hypothetical protein